MKTEQEYTAAVGHPPFDDDLERVNCVEAGEVGHAFCGWCELCDKPRIWCGHLQSSIKVIA